MFLDTFWFFIYIGNNYEFVALSSISVKLIDPITVVGESIIYFFECLYTFTIIDHILKKKIPELNCLCFNRKQIVTNIWFFVYVAISHVKEIES